MSYDRILDVAFELFSRDGYESTSILKIATELGIDKSYISNCFTSKENIFLAIINREVDKFLLFIEELIFTSGQHHVKEELFSLLKGITVYCIKFKANNRFWTNQIVFPLGFLQEKVLSAKEPVHKKLYEVELKIFERGVEEGKIKIQRMDDILYSYSTLIKGNITMSLMSEDFTNDNLESSFRVFWNGIEK